ncbi:uncharacterized protein [Drosophila virilis]|uniref:Uncharacterized protein, isoform A n=1 Tax=Drosophila virilis TaxID=7244 RepID=B4M8V2_DROVI|nr:uncharacterized protein LOC6634304 [Drosophila virilis]EDW57628.1 uncharacterized protein Dvir_GJ18035, isoform A [Drosophila virilis]KRF77843.1 uncharacterized protein Dvir_GJ18035, isoform B [Drosophila virilis]KRF77844.1 uncharacterized protein Dvir_GJ18035, isoform C [Drosophila virilis]KRF77845.1 uncharacterized protein Dvir_GJ18035, isoform D [Drosophila virilis]KRF77846.1 uncharacterized protein Dvir_GJ18035, isoform E [Drosophila virilis]
MASLAANTCKVKGVAAAASAESSAQVAPSSPRPVASSTPDAGHGRRGRKSKQTSSGWAMELRSRKYTEILGRRAIHAPRSGQKTPKSARAARASKTPKVCGTPGTPKTAKRLSKTRLKIEQPDVAPEQSTPQITAPKRYSPLSARRRKELLSIQLGPVSRRRPLYARRSPRIAEKRRAEEQALGLGNTIDSPYKRRRCERGSSVAVPQLRPPNAEKSMDSSTSRQRHYVLQPSSSLAASEQQREECGVTVSVLGTVKKDTTLKLEANLRVDVSTASENSAIETLANKSQTEQQPNPRVDASTASENLAIETPTPVETDLGESTLKPDERSLECGVQILAADNEGGQDDNEHGEQVAATSNSQDFVEDLPETETKEQELQLINARQSREIKAEHRDKSGCFLM